MYDCNTLQTQFYDQIMSEEHKAAIALELEGDEQGIG